MGKIIHFFENEKRTSLILFFTSLAIYSLYFYPIFFNINSVLSSITLDTLKNYYTYVYHIKNDPQLLHFTGMNYPFGEHIIYTDCQPILTFILRLMPFTHNYLIGIMHFMIFMSFIISPLILYKTLKCLSINGFTSFFVALGIGLLAPQFLKINAGHHALAYGFIIPLSILLILRYLTEKTKKAFWKLFIYNTLLFLLHPYLGFGASVFSFLALLLFHFSLNRKTALLKNILMAAIAGLFPILLFKLFMLLTDHHLNRTPEPYGAEMMVENADSMLAPVYGPFKGLMEYFFLNRTQHYEGHTYLGFGTILLTLGLLLTLPFIARKLKIQKEMVVILLASSVLLLLALGIHLSIFNLLHIKSAAFNQFRATCRFAWFFYYALPLFIIPLIYHNVSRFLEAKKFMNVMLTASLIFFSINLLEAHYYFKMDETVFWKFRNFFNTDHLNAEENKNLSHLKSPKPQAILPLPMFHGGSEMYDRTGSNNSMIPSMIYSYHSGIPIMSVLLSRTSITETEDMIQFLNSYKKEKNAAAFLSESRIFVIKTDDALLPDETRLLGNVDFFGGNDTLTFGSISKKDLLTRKTTKNIYFANPQTTDTTNVIYLASENRKPFLTANMNDFENVFVLDSNKLSTGNYVVSFHYYYTEKIYQSVACNLIVTRAHGKDFDWQYNLALRYLSGFYDGFAVFEQRIEISKENRYEFIMKGYVDRQYRISDFMLRPEATTVVTIKNNKDTLYNNFPE